MRNGEATIDMKLSDAQRHTVLTEMESIVADPVFRKSQRCVSLLRRMVEHAVAGDREAVKERTLGVEVFGREWDYDSNADPIVRMTANDIRKRLAQYYQNNQSHDGARIRLVPGSYIPEFEFVVAATPAVSSQSTEPGIRAPRLEPPQHDDEVSRHAATGSVLAGLPVWARWSAVGCALVLAVAVVLVAGRSRLFPSARSVVWKPLIQSGNPLILCLADNSALQQKGVEQLTEDEKRAKLQRIADMIASRKAPAITDPVNFDPTTPFVDAEVSHEITSWLSSEGQPTVLRRSSSLSLQDLRSRPVVLIGGFDNPWSVILLSDMRFSPRVDPATGTFWIADTQHPGKRDWARHLLQEPQPAVDYAVITRFFDTETGNWVLAIAGLGAHGTEAASELILDPEFAKSLPHGIRSAQNFQLVVATKVINANTGPPQVLQFHTW